jgi:peptidoglycan hydrolase CwlO-like protein
MRCAAVAVLAVVPLACGNGDGLTKTTFITQGDAICQRLTEESGKIKEPTSQEGIAGYLDQVIALADRAKADMAKLNPPADGQPVKDALLSSLDDTTAKARQALTAAQQGDMQAVQDRLAEASTAAVRADKQAKAYGFADCAAS